MHSLQCDVQRNHERLQFYQCRPLYNSSSHSSFWQVLVNLNLIRGLNCCLLTGCIVCPSQYSSIISYDCFSATYYRQILHYHYYLKLFKISMHYQANYTNGNISQKNKATEKYQIPEDSATRGSIGYTREYRLHDRVLAI